jgi:hypothetical protein
MVSDTNIQNILKVYIYIQFILTVTDTASRNTLGSIGGLLIWLAAAVHPGRTGRFFHLAMKRQDQRQSCSSRNLPNYRVTTEATFTEKKLVTCGHGGREFTTEPSDISNISKSSLH